MPRIINNTFKEEKNKQENQPIFLYTLYNYNGEGEDLNFTEYDQNVIYGGITYQKFPVKHEYIAENAQGEIDSVKVSLSNVSRLIQSYLEDYCLRGRKVSIKQVWANKLDDPDSFIEDIFYVDNYTTDQNNAEFILTSKFDVLSITLPLRVYSRNYCQWKFKSQECGYTGAETSCNKTKTRCKEIGNFQRFGGFPSIPTRRIVVG